MPTTTNKQRLLNQIFAHLPKAAREGPDGASHLPQGLPVLEQFLYAVCREGATREEGGRAFQNLRERFFDWNEVRVSSLRELSEALGGLPDAESRAQRAVDFLQEVFETTYSFDLEILHKKGLKQAAKQLARYQAANDYSVAWVIQQSLGGHAVPLDSPTLRVLRRLGLADDDQQDLEALRASLEHYIPKAKGSLFIDLISDIAKDYCYEDEPNCSACPLAACCAMGQERKALGGSENGTRHRPR
jgi:endonuclease-3